MATKARCKLESISPISFSKYYDVPKLPKETHKDYETRTWRERLHYDEDTEEIYIPPMAFKNGMSESAKYLSIKIPGKRNATYTKHIEAGILVLEKVHLGVKKNDVEGEWLFVPSDGKRGGGSRVLKCFPMVPKWSVEVTFYILDATVTRDVFEQHLREMGNFIGLGRFRPRNNGFYGRFEVKDIAWEVDA